MAILTTQRVGGTSGSLTHNHTTITGVFDLGKTVADDSFVTTDSMTLVQIPSGTIVESFDAEITEALNGTVTAIDMGYDTDTDPDNLVNNSSATAIGRLTSYESLAKAGEVVTTASALYVRATFSGTPTTGKIAWSLRVSEAAKNAISIANPHVYPNI